MHRHIIYKKIILFLCIMKMNGHFGRLGTPSDEICLDASHCCKNYV